MPFISTALAVGLGVAAAGSVASSAIGAHAAGKAASQQANASKSAQQIQQEEWQQQQQNEQPFLQQGTTAVNHLSQLVNDPSYSNYPGGTFSAPTLDEARNSPGYQFELQTGSDALTKQAAATGNLMSGNTGTELEKFGTGLADTTYGDLYNRSLQSYMTNYNVWNTDTSNQVNRLQALANLGGNTAANLGTQGQNFATNQGNLLNQQGTAEASGTVGAANAVTGGISNISNLAMDIPLYQLLAQQNKSSYKGVS